MVPHQVSEPADLASVIGRVSAVMSGEGFSTGDRAALRRMQPGQHPPLVFYRFAMRYLPDNWEKKQADWMAIVAGMALMSPQPHDPKQGLGRVLAEERFSEARLERLLASEGDVRRVLLLRAARLMAAKNRSVDWLQTALFLLIEDKSKLESLHRSVAKDFYYTQDQIGQQGVS